MEEGKTSKYKHNILLSALASYINICLWLKRKIFQQKKVGGGALSALALYQTVPDDPKQEMVRQIANAMSFCLFFFMAGLALEDVLS